MLEPQTLELSIPASASAARSLILTPPNSAASARKLNNTIVETRTVRVFRVQAWAFLRRLSELVPRTLPSNCESRSIIRQGPQALPEDPKHLRRTSSTNGAQSYFNPTHSGDLRARSRRHLRNPRPPRLRRVRLRPQPLGTLEG